MPTTITEQSLIITRDFSAPRDLVWKAWTQPDAFMRWWGPKDWTAPYCRIDLRVGGAYLNAMRAPGGRQIWTAGVYKEIVEPERIVYTDSFADEDGTVVPATHYGLGADFPLVTIVTVTFEETGTGTRMTLNHSGIPAGETANDTAAGWSESFVKLAVALK